MLDWLGSLSLREHTPMRVVLTLSRTTRAAGGVLLAGGIYLAVLLWPVSLWLCIAPGVMVIAGALLLTLRRDLVFDREAGVLRVSQRALFLSHRAVVPLFHLKAVVVVARPPRPGFPSVRYLAYVERRVGDAIYLDESRRCATLMHMAEAIADVADVRLEYDAMSHAVID